MPLQGIQVVCHLSPHPMQPGQHLSSCSCFVEYSKLCLAQMRGTISPANPWDVMVDLFFYREPEEVKEEEAEEPYGAEGTTAGYTPAMAAAPGKALTERAVAGE